MRPDQTTSASGASWTRLEWAVVAILLLGALLRWLALGRMGSMLYLDEAYYGADALSLLRAPQLTAVFPANFGRESAWMYWLAPFIAVFGSQPFGLRLAAAFVGELTLAAVYVFAREVVDRRSAMWATLGLAVLYWHVHMNHIVWRANLLTLVGALAFAALLKAYRTGHRRRWLLTGLLFGVLMYTYFSARAWIGLGVMILGGSLIFSRKHRSGSALALTVIVVVSLPMIHYVLTNPAVSFSRIGEVATLEANDILHNLQLWSAAWFQQGDLALMPNIPGRPILDPVIGALLVGGLVGVTRCVRERRYLLLLTGLAATAVLPSLISEAAPHFLRANGLTIVIAVIIGAGAAWIEQTLQRVWNSRWVTAVPLGLLLISAMLTYRDFSIRWLNDARVSIYMEEYTNRPVDFIKRHIPPDEPIYFVPHSVFHPVIIYRSDDLAPRPVGAFDSYYCQVASDVPAVYVVNGAYEPDYDRTLAQWADVRVLQHSEVIPGFDADLGSVFGEINPSFRPPPQRDLAEPRRWYTIYEATPRAAMVTSADQSSAIFGDAVRMRSLVPISTTVRPGDAIPIRLGLQAARPLTADYNVFAHLYGIPTPYAGGQMWSVADSPACISYPASKWQPHDIVLQDLLLTVPPDLPPGRYLIALGIYDRETGIRLPLTFPAPQPGDYFALREVTVEPR